MTLAPVAPPSAAYARINRLITKTARLAAARRWEPVNPLLVHAMAVEDAIHRRRAVWQ